MIKKTWLFVLLLTVQLNAEIVTYPIPVGVDASDKYIVRVMQYGEAKKSFVYQSTSNFHLDKRGTTASWTTFSFSDEIEILVTKLDGDIESCQIRPLRFGIEPIMQGNTIRFKIDRPRKLSIEFNSDITHGLLLFADTLETNIPEKDDVSVMYFEPGVHTMGKEVELNDNDYVYIAGGAYVYGSFVVKGNNVKIHGRGVLSAKKWPKYYADKLDGDGKPLLKIPEHQFNMVEVKDVYNTYVEGITFVDHPHYVMRGGFKTTIENVKSIGWLYNCDGLTCKKDGVIRNCFLRVNDDALKLYHDNMLVEDIVIWQYYNGAPFQWNWHTISTKNVRVKNCDVIHIDYASALSKNKAVFNAASKNGGSQTDYVFENIYIEDIGNSRLFRYNMPYDGKIEATFKNLHVNGDILYKSVLEGDVNLNFEGFYLNGKPVKKARKVGFLKEDKEKIIISNE